jgi:UDP-N-acetylmuramoyl-tripeptide--D-alanyl-D-alanine ligase
LITPQGAAWVELKVPGIHNVRNALAAAACATALNIDLSDIAAGLSSFGGVSGRMTYRPGKNNALIIDDTYNANLRSTLSAIDVLRQRTGRRIFVFGDMGELGAMSQQHHQEVGEMARAHGIDILMACGTQSQWTTKGFGEAARHYPTQDSLIQDLLPLLDETTTVLVKGSRSSAMEYVVRHLLAEA